VGHSRDRRDGRLRRRSPALAGAALALACLVGSAGAASPNEAAAKALEDLAGHCRRHLPDLDLTQIPVSDLVARAKSPDESQDALRTEILKALKALTDHAKVEVLRKIRLVADTLAGSPTDPGSYEYRRQLVLSFDKIERAAGRRPGYPRELGRPFVTLIERPSKRELEKLDGYLRYLAKVKPPKLSGGGGLGPSGGRGRGGGPGQPEHRRRGQPQPRAGRRRG
jgi:hypothetical protein